MTAREGEIQEEESGGRGGTEREREMPFGGRVRRRREEGKKSGKESMAGSLGGRGKEVG